MGQSDRGPGTGRLRIEPRPRQLRRRTPPCLAALRVLHLYSRILRTCRLTPDVPPLNAAGYGGRRCQRFRQNPSKVATWKSVTHSQSSLSSTPMFGMAGVKMVNVVDVNWALTKRLGVKGGDRK